MFRQIPWSEFLCLHSNPEVFMRTGVFARGALFTRQGKSKIQYHFLVESYFPVTLHYVYKINIGGQLIFHYIWLYVWVQEISGWTRPKTYRTTICWSLCLAVWLLSADDDDDISAAFIFCLYSHKSLESKTTYKDIV